MTLEPIKRADSELSQYRVQGEIPVPTLIGWLTLAAVPLLIFFAYRSSLRGDPLTPALLLAFAGLLAANGLVYLGIRHSMLQRRGFITIISALFTYLAVQAVEDGSAIIWLFAYPPIIFYISQARVGVIACSGGLAAVALLFSPLGDLVFDSPYSTSFRLTMLAVLAFEMSTCYVLDQSRRRSKLSLLKLAKEFEYAAKHDALTGLANRREVMTQLDGEYQRYLRNSRVFSVLLMDIDLFKSVNDNYGHHVGDEMIVLVATTLREQCRKVDTLARWGGERNTWSCCRKPESRMRCIPPTASARPLAANRYRPTIGPSPPPSALAWPPSAVPNRWTACCNGPMKRSTGPRPRAVIPSAIQAAPRPEAPPGYQPRRRST